MINRKGGKMGGIVGWSGGFIRLAHLFQYYEQMLGLWPVFQLLKI